MNIPTIRSTTTADEDAAVSAVVLAFATDPVARWCWPDPQAYLASMPMFIRAFVGRAFRHDGAFCSADHAAAALWLLPGVSPDEEAVDQLIEDTIAKAVASDLHTAFEQMAGHHPTEPHWYLPAIGVDPAYQGRGYGGALMSYALERCDREGVPAYLESSNPRNISLYKRHGFATVGQVQVGSSPTIVPMVRPAR